MGKKYRCVENHRINGSFKINSIYEMNDKGEVVGDDGYIWGPQFPSVIEWLEQRNWYKFEEVKDMFTMDDLKTGMLVELRDGDRCLVLRNNGCNDPAKDALVSVKQRMGYNFESYHTNGKYKGATAYDIMRVFNPNVYPYISDADYEFRQENHVIFDRNKIEERKRMTVEEIEKQLGYKIAVVDKEGADRE